MSELIERAEKAIAAWKAGAINHSLHLELANLVEEMHALVTIKPDDAEAATPPPLPGASIPAE